MNISAKTKIFKGVNLGSRYYGFMEKTRLQKSHVTVPLRLFNAAEHLYYELFHMLSYL